MSVDIVLQKPLLAVATSYASEIKDDMTQEEKDSIEAAFDGFLNNLTPFFEASKVIQGILGTTKPLDRVSTILQTTDIPIPNFFLVPPMNSQTDRKKTRSWTDYEDQRLLAGIHRFGLDNWQTIASFVGNGRTRAQCSQRWVRGLDPRISKDRWTKEDESLLLELVNQYGSKSWTKIASEMGNRSDVQCRYHYKQMTHDDSGDSEKLLPSRISTSGSVPTALTLSSMKNEASNSIGNESKVVLPSISSFLNPNPRPRISLAPSLPVLPPVFPFIPKVSSSK